MRQNTPDLNLESSKIVPPFSTMAERYGTLPDLLNVEVYVLGADDSDKSTAHWQSLQSFWKDYFRNAGGVVQNYSVLR